MTDAVVIWTLDWVPMPDGPAGFVRDVRLRWACEEAGLPYRVRTIPFQDRAANHLDRQPFGQVPYLDDGDVQIFESGACLLYLAQKSDALMPADAAGRAQVLQWTMAALNSVEIVTLPWWFLNLAGTGENGLTGWLESRLDHMERVLAGRDWLAAGRFTVADLAMADVLRIPSIRSFGQRPATESYVRRVTDRPAFAKAHAAQMAHFQAAEAARGQAQG